VSFNLNQRSTVEYSDTLLEKGPKACGELFAEAQAESISKHQLYRAKDDLGVKSVKRGDSWYWYIPVIEQTFNCDQAIEAIS